MSPLPQSEFTSQPPPLDRSLSTPTQPAFFSSKSMIVRKKTADSIDSVSLYRSTTSSTTSSRPMKDVRRPISPIDSESEYGGLAYANSTDSDSALPRSQSDGSHLPTSARRHRPSGSDPSENGNDRTGILIGSTTSRPSHSSASSRSSAGGRSHTRSNSSAIAQALGLSQTAPSDYGRIGGPGVMGGRNGLSRRNTGPNPIEEMAALEDAKTKTRNKQSSFGSSSGHSALYRADTTSSASSSRDLRVVTAHRSNTIQSPRPTSPEKAVKLPMRATTSPKHDRDNKALDGTGARKERVRKAKVCLKCQKVIDNGRWVSVDGGGVLCERCWKNMYLPKVSFIPYFPICLLI
jgi:PDZ and LIM domain protein 5/6/7